MTKPDKPARSKTAGDLRRTANLIPFSKGADPRRNIRGRPPGNACLTSLIKEVGSADGSERLRLIATKLLDLAASGNVSAISLALDRIDGRVPTTNNVNAHGMQPATFQLVIADGLATRLDSEPDPTDLCVGSLPTDDDNPNV